MSTRIYTGFKIATTDFERILEIVRDFRPWVAEQQLQVFEEFCELINGAREREKGHPDYYKDTFWPWMDARREIKKTGLRDVMVDTDFEAVFLPYGGEIYGMSFVERNRWHREWLKQPGVSEFAYWDHTDGPDDISDDEWERRGDLWRKILPGAGVPALHGFTIHIGDPLGPDLYKHADARRLVEG